jgi:hypothetical protein
VGVSIPVAMKQSAALLGYQSKKPGDAGVIDEGEIQLRRVQLNKAASEALVKQLIQPGGKLNVKYKQGTPDDAASAIQAWVHLIGCDVAHGKTIMVSGLKPEEQGRFWSRSYYSPESYSIHLAHKEPWIIWHELGHMLEHLTPGGIRAAHAFLDTHSRGPVQKLSVLNPKRPGYDDDEEGKAGTFPEPYLGKRYADDTTEVTSMAMQYLKEDPGKLYKDIDLFYYLLGMIAAARKGGFPWKD